jgi:hypothetical protein
MQINGVAVVVDRLSGPGLPQYLRELEAHWREDASQQLQWQQAGSWQVLGHARGGEWEVLQRRDGPRGAEALLSRVRLDRAPSVAITPGLSLPPACRQQSAVELDAQESPARQLSLLCQGSGDAVARRIRTWSATQGWSATGPDQGPVIALRRGLAQATWIVSPDRPRGSLPHSAVLLITTAAKELP